MKIAVGIDFSPESELAARQALEVARHVGGELVLVHAELTVELPEIGAQSEPWLRPSMDTLRGRLAEEQARDRERLAQLRERLSGQGPVVSQVLVEGYPEEALCRAADALVAAILMVGTHGRTGLRWFLLGSVAQYAVRASRTDVMVARRLAGRGGFRRILVATDFSASSERALDRALELAAPDAELHAVHFYHLHPAMGWGDRGVLLPPELEASLARELQAEGEKLLEGRRRRGGPRLVFHVVHGSPLPGIVHWLEQHDFDLAALGSHGRRGLRRAMLGSVAEAVVRRAPCSVLVAHQQTPPA
jgi:nucleotide-binding universal stress UspA family protein